MTTLRRDFRPFRFLTVVLSLWILTVAVAAAEEAEGANATNEIVFLEDPTGATAGLVCEAASTPLADRLVWRIDPPWVAPVVWAWAGGFHAVGRGAEVTALFIDLPEDNDQFGPRTVDAAFDFAPDPVHTARFELFFPRSGTRHPGNRGVLDDQKTPNWYYYWGKVLGVYGEPNYSYNARRSTSRTIVRSATDWTIEFAPNACWPDAAGNPPTGQRLINGFAATKYHEEWHRDHRIHNFAVHGGRILPADADIDGDGICNREPTDPPELVWGGWEAKIGGDPLRWEGVEIGANWAERMGVYGYEGEDWSEGGFNYRH